MKTFDELMSSINEKASKEISHRNKIKKILLSSASGLCLVAVIAAAAFQFIPDTSLDKNTSESIDSSLSAIPPENIDTSLRGLEVDNFKMPDIQTGVMADRMVAMKLSDFFSYYPPDAFVFVRVFDTKQWEYENKEFEISTLNQTSSVQVISELWNHSGMDIPQTLLVEQSLYGGCMGMEKTNMLRKDGVYLLPLKKSDREEKWHINFDLDVLFEVDNEGKVWSHSKFEKFNFYDGKDASVLSDTVIEMTANENFVSAFSPLGRMTRNWKDTGALVRVKISSAEAAKDEWGADCHQYTFSEFNPFFASDKQNTGAISFENADLKVGFEYLLFLDYSENVAYIENNRIAKIGDDGTISPVNDDNRNIFAEFNGYTAEQIKAETDRANAWQSEFGEK